MTLLLGKIFSFNWESTGTVIFDNTTHNNLIEIIDVFFYFILFQAFMHFAV
jgi:hypothetical protein